MIPNITTGTAAEIINHAAIIADGMCPRDSRDAFLIDRLKIVIEKLVAQRDQAIGKPRSPGW